MLMEQLKNCLQCTGSFVKNGRTKNGNQRFYCRNCKKSVQQSYLYRACYRQMNERIISLTRESCGIRSISRLLGISPSTVIARIKTIGLSLQRPFPILNEKEYELDELRTFIGKKERLYWVAYAMRKDTRQVVDFRVGRRTLKTLKSVTTTLLLSNAKRIFTDGYSLYQNLLPQKIHKRSSYNINYIERKNLSIRTHLKRLGRKTICFSRSVAMLEACLKIYFWSHSTPACVA